MYRKILSLVLCLALVMGICTIAGASDAKTPLTVKFNANGGKFPDDQTELGYIFGNITPKFDSSDTNREVAIVENIYFVGDTLKNPTIGNGPDYDAAHVFVGWSTTKDDISTVMHDQSRFAAPAAGSEVTLYAFWATELVTLDPNGGTLDSGDPNSFPIYAGGKYPVLPTPTRTGFDFDGWYTEKTDGDKVAFDDPFNSSSSHTLYAHWTAKPVEKTITVSFDAMGGSVSSSSKAVTVGQTYGELPAATPGTGSEHSGQTFKGWYTEKFGGTKVESSSTVEATSDITLYAHWDNITVTFQVGLTGVSVPSNDLTRKVSSGEVYSKAIENGVFIDKNLPSPTHSQYQFAGWYLNAEATGNPIVSSSIVNTTQNHTLYAKWASGTYTVTFNANGGTVSPTTRTYTFGEKYTNMPTPTLTNYEFDGWYDAASGGNRITADTPVTAADRTLYAHWTQVGNVRLDPNGGTLPSGAHATIHVDANGRYPMLPTPSRDGYTFAGWTLEKDNINTLVRENGNVGASAPTALFACWTARKYQVTFDFNGASGGPITREYSYGGKYSSLPSAHRGGYAFVGWFTEKDGGTEVTIETEVTTAKDHTLYARWGFTVDYNANGGTGSMPQSKALAETAFTLPSCSFTPPTGMVFSHWSIGSEMGPEITESSYTFTANTTLYAHWKDSPLTITASATSGGSISPSGTISVDKGNDVVFRATARSGYELADLIVDGESYGPLESHVFRNVEEDHTIRAVFLPESLPGYLGCAQDLNCPLNKFTDLNPTAWYHDAVHYCLDNVLLTGVSNTVYALSSKTDRASLATILWRAAGCPNPVGSGALERPYKDVSATDSWFYKGVVWATKNGIVSGYGNGYFGPSDLITREQVAAILWRHAGTPKPLSDSLPYADSWNVSDYFWDAMCWATEEGIINGKGNGILDPKGNATRVEIAQMMLNYFGDQ